MEVLSWWSFACVVFSNSELWEIEAVETVLKSTVLGSDVFSSLSFGGKSTREIPQLSPSGQIGTADSLPVGVTHLGCCFFSSSTTYLFMTQVTTYRPHDSWRPKDDGWGSSSRAGDDGVSSK